MNNRVVFSLLMAVLMLMPVPASAEGPLTQADHFFTQGGLDNYKKAIALYQKALTAKPESYEANWKTARAFREYGYTAKSQKIEGWKKVCAESGKKGMTYAKKAAELEPDKPEGHYHYGLSVGIYSDGVSILTALSEGLKKKTQTSFERTYDIDKMYKKGGPMLSLGRFWAVLPWPMRDRKKALEYYREYRESGYFDANMEAHVYLGELLVQIGGEENRSEARKYLEKASTAKNNFFRDQARALLSKMDREQG